MDSSPGGTFLRPIGAATMPRACRKPSRCTTYLSRLMGLGDRIDVFSHSYSDVYSTLDRGIGGERACLGQAHWAGGGATPPGVRRSANVTEARAIGNIT